VLPSGELFAKASTPGGLIGNAESFESWKAIGKVLCVGKHHALRVASVNQAWGQNYSRAFGGWMKEHHFDKMPKSVRSYAIEMYENIAAIGHTVAKMDHVLQDTLAKHHGAYR